METIMAVIWAVVMGAVSGIIAACLGYAKGASLEKIDSLKFLTTVLFGAVIGGLMGYFGWDYNTAYQFFITSGLVYLVENIAKAIYRRMPKSEPKVEKPKKKKGKAKVVPVNDDEEDDDSTEDKKSEGKEVKKTEDKPKKKDEEE
jgi:hypothetical protein